MNDVCLTDLCENIVLCVAQICMLQTVVCFRCVFFVAAAHFLPAWWNFFSDYLYSGRSLVYFWYDVPFVSCCLLWLWFLEMRLDIACTFCMGKVTCLTITYTSATFLKLDLCFNEAVCDNTKVVGRYTLKSQWPLTKHRCAKNVPLFYCCYTGKKNHTQSWCCFVLCVSISLF